MDHFGPFWSRECQSPVQNKVILTKTVVLTILDHFVRGACVQNETAPEKFLNRYEKRFEKREKGSEKRSEKRSETRLKNF